ncbi:VOC family protein [Nocardia grenadensis]|uniref:VOC family protein n=1 Tax=Nocardia grenadensis TaxID=931537 RepID=UPI0007A45B87|nr:VOC family protein [Nocardia grenadensis]
MEQQAHFLTLATADLDAARRFYVDGLGWEPLLDVPDEIIFFQIAPGLVLGFFEAAKFAADISDGSDRAAVSGLTLSHNVGSRDEVRDTVDAVVAAGGTVLKQPRDSEFGGIFNGHVADPNGVVWEIAYNPAWRIDPDGSVVLS